MKHYIDIKLLPDEEIPIYFLRNKVYNKFHKARFDLPTTEIGISFPHYEARLLGDLIRLHGTDINLDTLQSKNWLAGLVSYCEVHSIRAIPKQVRHRTIARKQANMTEAKLRRLIKRGSIAEQDIKGYKTKMFQQSMANPYLELKSRSNGQLYRRYIQFGELRFKSVEGKFDQFGLSNTASIPWF